MNTRQQRYFLLGVILLSFLLLGQDEKNCWKESCGFRERSSNYALVDEYIDITISLHRDDCGGDVTPRKVENVLERTTTTFTVTPGNCKSMYVQSEPLVEVSQDLTTISVFALDEDIIFTVNLYDTCEEGPYQFPICQRSEMLGRTPLIQNGEVAPGIYELSEDEVYPPLPEPEPAPVGTCNPSGTACAPPDMLTSFCCNGYCGPFSTCW